MQFLFFIVICLCCKGFTAQYAITANADSDNASIVNITTPSSPSVISTVGVGDNPQGIAVTPNAAYALIANYNSSTVSMINIIDPSSPSVTSTTSVGSNPIDLAVTPNGRYAVVLNDGSDNVSILNITNPVSPSITGTISVGSDPLTQLAIAVTPNGQYSVVLTRENFRVNLDQYRVTVLNIIDPAAPSIQGSVILPGAAGDFGAVGGLAVTPDGSYCITAENSKISMVSIINPSAPSVVSTLLVSGATFVGTAVSPNGQYAFATDSSSNTLYIFDITNPSAMSTLSSVSVGTSPRDVAITRDGLYAVVTNSGSNNVSVVSIVDPASPSVVGTVTVGTNPRGVAVFPLLQDLTLTSGFHRTSFQKVIVNTLSWPTPSLFFTPITYLIGRTSNDGSPSQGFYVPVHHIGTSGLLTFQDAYRTASKTQYTYTVTAIGTPSQTDEVATGIITTP